MSNIILVVVVLVIVGVLVFAATKPDKFSITRKLVIKSNPENIFVEINDFKRWASWSPWEKKDPLMKRSFSGSALGVGTVYDWDGDKNVGQGRMEITESVPSQKIIIKLDFFKPFEAHNFAVFTLTPTEGGTLVNWEMYGPQVFIGKLMSVFMNMDKMVGSDFEAGLANMKRLVESKAE